MLQNVMHDSMARSRQPLRDDGTEFLHNLQILPQLYETDIILNARQAREIVAHLSGSRRQKRKVAPLNQGMDLSTSKGGWTFMAGKKPQAIEIHEGIRDS